MYETIIVNLGILVLSEYSYLLSMCEKTHFRCMLFKSTLFCFYLFLYFLFFFFFCSSFYLFFLAQARNFRRRRSNTFWIFQAASTHDEKSNFTGRTNRDRTVCLPVCSFDFSRGRRRESRAAVNRADRARRKRASQLVRTDGHPILRTTTGIKYRGIKILSF